MLLQDDIKKTAEGGGGKSVIKASPAKAELGKKDLSVEIKTIKIKIPKTSFFLSQILSKWPN
jgi:hypothetical protein